MVENTRNYVMEAAESSERFENSQDLAAFDCLVRSVLNHKDDVWKTVISILENHGQPTRYGPPDIAGLLGPESSAKASQLILNCIARIAAAIALSDSFREKFEVKHRVHAIGTLLDTSWMIEGLHAVLPNLLTDAMKEVAWLNLGHRVIRCF